MLPQSRRMHFDAEGKVVKPGDEGVCGLRLITPIEQELRGFLTCGVLAHGLARLQCTECALERLVPFSCKGRGFCWRSSRR